VPDPMPSIQQMPQSVRCSVLIPDGAARTRRRSRWPARNLQFSSDIIVEVRDASSAVELLLVDLNGRRTRCEATTDAFSATQ
jgi:hypothetical protein